jgi:uncharacterized protein (TIGR02058 family)
MERYIIEFGLGTDFHGQSVTRAAEKAVRDAVSRSCLSGLQEVLGLSLDEMNEKVLLKISIAVSRPEEVDVEVVATHLPIGKKEFTLVTGGLKVRGINISEFGDSDDSIKSAIACIEVCMID